MFNPNGVTGDKFLVNGVYQPYLEVGDRKYRFRILNASNFRTYFLELSSGDSFIQIGTESGLLPVPVTRTGMRMGPAERWTWLSISPVNWDKTSIWWMR